MTVIAEGIETFEELAYLQAATRIRYAQGFYFAHPIFLEELKMAAPVASGARVNEASRPVRKSPGLCAPHALSPLSGRAAFYPPTTDASIHGPIGALIGHDGRLGSFRPDLFPAILPAWRH